jgi:light-harvesting protein B-800-850 alpha chain
MWLVVNPTVGLPLFLGGVAVIAFTVHFAILNNTTYFSAFFGG